MKITKIITAALLGALCVSCAPKGSADTLALLPSKAQRDSVSYLVGVQFGSFIKGYGFGDLNDAMVKKGMQDFIKAKGDWRDESFAKQFKIDPNLLNEMFNSYLEKMQAYTAAKNLEEGQKFLEKNKAKDGVEISQSGLQYKISEMGNDVRATEKDTVVVHYKGTLLDGTVFDKTEEGSPATFELNRVIKAWTEGLALVGEGGKLTLYVPAELGYGERGTRGIEPNSALIFDVELVSVKPYKEPASK